MLRFLQSLVTHPRARALLDSPVVFSGVRFFLVGLQRGTKRRLRDSLDLPERARVLDVCCGPGDFAGLVEAEYHGVDLNPRFIQLAQRRYRRTARKMFRVIDATRMEFPDRWFHTTLFINAMHHFPTDMVRRMLREMARVTSARLIVFDMDAQQGAWWQRVVMACDRGDHARPIATQRALLEEQFHIEDSEVYPSGCIVQTMFVCAPKSSAVPDVLARARGMKKEVPVP